jgi:hypothetical protein
VRTAQDTVHDTILVYDSVLRDLTTGEPVKRSSLDL